MDKSLSCLRSDLSINYPQRRSDVASDVCLACSLKQKIKLFIAMRLVLLIKARMEPLLRLEIAPSCSTKPSLSALKQASMLSSETFSRCCTKLSDTIPQIRCRCHYHWFETSCPLWRCLVSEKIHTVWE